jgi:hypothetical protein
MRFHGHTLYTRLLYDSSVMVATSSDVVGRRSPNPQEWKMSGCELWAGRICDVTVHAVLFNAPHNSCGIR